MQGRRNLAARAGHWSATHRRTAIFGWLAFVLAALFVGGAVGTKNIATQDAGTGESRRADQSLAAAGFFDRAAEQVLIQSREGTLRDDYAGFRAAVGDVVIRLRNFDT